MAKAPNPHMTKMTLIKPNGKTEHIQGHLTRQWTAANLHGHPSMEITIQGFEHLEVPFEKKTPEQEREELLKKHTVEIGKRIRDLRALRVSNEQAKARMELQHAVTEQNAYHGLKNYVMDAWKGSINGQDLLDALPKGSQRAMDTVLNDLREVVLDDLADIV